MKRLLAIIVLVFMFVAGCGNKNTNTTYTPTEGQENEITEEVTKEIKLYYSVNDASFLTVETRSVSEYKADDAEYVLNQLIEGSEDKNLVSSVPDGTKVISCETKDELCTVNLSEEFIKESGTASQTMAIYSIVNTLCEIDGIEKVQFLIDGEKVMIYGNYIFDEPFEPDMTIVKN